MAMAMCRAVQPQRDRARLEEVGPAPHHGALTHPLVRRHRHGDVEPVDEADAIRGLVVGSVVEAELGQRGRRGAATAVALEAVAAVSGGAGETAVGVGAVGSGPYAAGPGGCGGAEGAVGECGEGETAAFQDRVAGVGLDAGPDCVWAVVDEGQDETSGGLGLRLGLRGEEGEEEDRDQWEWGSESEIRRGHGCCLRVFTFQAGMRRVLKERVTPVDTQMAMLLFVDRHIDERASRGRSMKRKTKSLDSLFFTTV
ncbi:hypothetical protein Dimus_009103 [Dionaea muscipula]